MAPPASRCLRLGTSEGGAFLSKRAGRAFLGYLTAQRERLLGLRGQRDVRREHLASEHGYDTKYAMHALRLGFQGVEFLTGRGRLTLPMRESTRALLMSVRRGELELADATGRILALELAIEALLCSSPACIPDEPDRARIDRLLVGCYADHWRARGLLP